MVVLSDALKMQGRPRLQQRGDAIKAAYQQLWCAAGTLCGALARGLHNSAVAVAHLDVASGVGIDAVSANGGMIPSSVLTPPWSCWDGLVRRQNPQWLDAMEKRLSAASIMLRRDLFKAHILPPDGFV
jgi:hypothetical protein